jgi:membrane fusion protein (multidrug efflux system)
MNASASSARRGLALLLILVVFAAIAASAALWYWRIGQWRASTGNAYLAGNLVTVSAEISGTVVRITAEENDAAAAGAELVTLAEGDSAQALDAATQQLALAVQEVRALRAQVGRARAELRLREVTARLAREEYARRQRLSARKVLAEEELDAARTRAEETAGALETARQALLETEVRAGEGAIEHHPQVTSAASLVRAAWREWRKTRVLAPVSGRIARRRVQLGQRVDAGVPLFSIVEDGALWVEANFKEDQLRHLRSGQPVEMRSDLYGDGWLLHGRVSGIGAGTGAVFAVLPPQNATGNWIKIVQRVPVRIELDQPPDAEHPLPLGASLEVRVDTHDRRGSRLPLARTTPADARSAVYDDHDQGVEALIERTIAGATAPVPPP